MFQHFHHHHHIIEHELDFLLRPVAAAFELYLHELLRRLGYQIEVHPDNPAGKPSRPDFLATCPDGTRLYVEAVVATETSKEERGAAARMNAVYDVINQLGPTASF